MHIFDARCVPGMVMRITQAEPIQIAVTETGVLLVADVVMFLSTLGIIAAYDPLAGVSRTRFRESFVFARG